MERRLPLSPGGASAALNSESGAASCEPVAPSPAPPALGARCPSCGTTGELGTRCARDDRWFVEPAALARGDGDPLLGAALGGRFVVEAWLGLGSTAGVYRGRDLVSGATSVLKVLRDDGPTGAMAIELATAEAEALRRVRTPRVVSLLEAGVVELPGGEARAAWLALESLGPSLDELARAASSAERAVIAPSALRGALLALDDLHAAGLAHGDLKPEHLLRRPDGSGWVLVDLGSTASAARGAGGWLAPCSPAYAAPERATEGASVAADLYAVGRLALWLLDGRLPPHGEPFAFDTTTPVDAGDPREAFPATGTLSGWVAELVHLDPTRRPHSAREALARFEFALGRSSASAPA